MENYVLFFVILLLVLAVADLVVGVSNDAVNFLNSAIGSKVATRVTIMVVASLGVLIGASFSSGMMEVAKSGIFLPQSFQFMDIMIIFLAVMLTDILLLDLFNTFGLPTSTTVSIVFELLGASTIVAIIKMGQGNEAIGSIYNYINAANAVTIISAILISVAISFTVGTFSQFVVRLIFGFDFQRRIKTLGPIFAGVAFTTLLYFLLVKGAKGASFITAETVEFLNSNALIISLVLFVGFTVLFFVLQRFGVNPLRWVVLFGTFSLAMAFASNDLVNFIGVPIAGYEAYLIWQADPATANQSMGLLAEPVPATTYLLVLAGVIMVFTLWTSKKAQSVTETEVNLGRQDESAERFAPNAFSRLIVQAVISISAAVKSILPGPVLRLLERQFDSDRVILEGEDRANPPAFDLVRAAVNLTVASALIASATSLKLPLSTTYVTFMVAMGSSLADKAWGRDSAVYRVAGVFNVIGGWFLTAAVAFTTSAIFAWIIFKLEALGVLLLVLAIVATIARTFITHRVKHRREEAERKIAARVAEVSLSQLIEETRQQVAVNLKEVALTYRSLLDGLLNNNQAAIRLSRRQMKDFADRNKSVRSNIVKTVRMLGDADNYDTRQYILVYDLEQDMAQSMVLISSSIFKYIDNHHKPIEKNKHAWILELEQKVVAHLELVQGVLKESRFTDYPLVVKSKRLVYERIDTALENLVEEMRQDNGGSKGYQLLLRLTLESKDLIAESSRFVRLYKEMLDTRMAEEQRLIAKDLS